MMKFFEYIAKRDGVNLEEAARRSLGHVYKLAQSENPLAIITAFRGENNDKPGVNLALNQRLKWDLRNMGFGYIPVVGGYVENVIDTNTGQETGEKRKVEEESFLVSLSAGMPNEKLREMVLGLIVKYSQESAVIKYADSPDAKLLKQNGSEINLGKWNAKSMSDYWTRMRFGHNPQGRRFTFEHAEDDTRSTKMAIYYSEREWNKK